MGGSGSSSGVIVVVTVVVMVVMVSGFNIESERFTVHRGSPDTKFGFSVSQHRDSNGDWVLVGAPEAQTGQRGVVRGGAVFRCHPAHADDCTPVPFDDTGNHWEAGRQMDNKSMQWFGAHVTSRSGVMVACAPRYVWIRPNRREPVGRCLYGTGRDSDGYKMYSPCMASASWGYHQQGSCQAGFGAAITQNGNRLYVGAVGSFYWQGQVFFQDLLNTRDHLSTPEGPKRYDMSYLGYSVTHGEFTGDEEEDLAVGMPRGNDLKGVVVILNHRLSVFYNISGEQLGAYFGYSVASADVNGDGLDDVLVGAPWYTPVDNTDNFEVGQVIIFTQTSQHNFKIVQRLEGPTSRGHFGLSLTSLGDLNKDGFQDFAVGAPYAGLGGAGQVFIYLGREGGPGKEPSQVLTPGPHTQGQVVTFGWAVSGGRDLDLNDYPDLVVGAHGSDAAIVYLTRPVVNINTTLKFRSAKGIIDLEIQGCSLSDGFEVPCVSLLYCLSYQGHRVPNKLRLDVSVRVDTLAKVSPRMFFLRRERRNVLNVTLDLRKSVENCTTVYTYVEPDVRDKLTPLVAELRASLAGTGASGGVGATGGLRPILAPPSPPYTGPPQATIYIKNNCGEDNICIPNLAVTSWIDQEEYVIGSPEHVSIKAMISNTGEDSFQAILRASIPTGVTYASFNVVKPSQDVTPICSLNYKAAVKEVVCEVGNPLPSGTEISLNLVFQPYAETINGSDLVFTFSLSSANKDEDESDNEAIVMLPVVMRSDVVIEGISLPDGTFDYNATRYGYTGEDRIIRYESEIGPQVEHIYVITNGGPSSLPPSTLYLLWPTRTLGNEPLLYLVEPPAITSPLASCSEVSDVNYLDLKVDEPRKMTSAFSTQILRRTDEIGDHNEAQEEGEEDIDEAQEEEEEDTAEGMVLPRHKRHRETLLNTSPYTTTHHHINNSHHHHHHRHHHAVKKTWRSRRRRRSMEDVEKELACGPTNCTRVVCEVRTLAPRDNIVVRVRSRLWIDTLEQLGMTKVSLSSRVVLTTGVPGGLYAGSVSSVVSVGPRESRRSLKWLVIAGSILAGLLLLALLCAILWAMGFFKRKRPQDGAESEPLSSNGYFNNGKT